MSKAQMLRGLVNQRLTAAAQEICGLFEGTLAEYEEELCSLKEENERHRKLLHAVFNPEVRVQRAENPQPPHIKEDQEDPGPPYIKEDQEELWTNQEGEQLQFSFSLVKNEEDEKEAQCSHLHQRQTEPMETEADGADCGGPEPDRKLDPESDPGPDADETEYSDDGEETQAHQSDVNPLLNNEVPVRDVNCRPGNTSTSSPACAASVDHQGHLEKPSSSKTGEKPVQCSLCDKRYGFKKYLNRHMLFHTGEKPFSCSVCSKTFTRKGSLSAHMHVHTGEKPFSCSLCGKRFSQRPNLKRHFSIHTRETN